MKGIYIITTLLINTNYNGNFFHCVNQKSVAACSTNFLLFNVIGSVNTGCLMHQLITFPILHSLIIRVITLPGVTFAAIKLYARFIQVNYGKDNALNEEVNLQMEDQSDDLDHNICPDPQLSMSDSI